MSLRHSFLVAAGLWSTSFALVSCLAGCSGGDSGRAPAKSIARDSGAGDAGTTTASNDGGSVIAPPLDFSQYDAAIEAFLAANHLKGGSGVVVHKDWGLVHEKGYGSFAKDRKYLVASSSKIVSVGILMRLADQGLVDIDAPIGNLLSSWGAGKPELEVAELVSNSSGLVSLTDNALYAPYLCQYLDTGVLSTCAETIYTTTADAADRKTPDTEFHYGGGQWQLAGGIAESVSGKKWAELVQETYIDGCGASSFGYGNQFTQAFTSGGDGGSIGAALSYPAFFQGEPTNLHPTENPSIEGGLYTTAADYGKILLMHLRGGTCDGKRVLSQAAVERMRVDRIGETYSGSTGNADLAGYGLGWWVDRNHPGVFADPGAYGAFPWLDLTRDYAAFLVIESDSGVGAKLWLAVKPTLDQVFDSAPK